jgi:hypothetical protein
METVGRRTWMLQYGSHINIFNQVTKWMGKYHGGEI